MASPLTFAKEDAPVDKTTEGAIKQLEQDVIFALNKPKPDVKEAERAMTKIHTSLDSLNLPAQQRNALESKILTDIAKQIYEEKTEYFFSRLPKKPGFQCLQ